MIQNNIAAITIVFGAVIFLLALSCAYLYLRLRRLEVSYGVLTRGTEGKNFVEIVNENIAETELLIDEVKHLSDMYASLLKRMAGSIQHIGVVRYDAFRDVGGIMSFSVALLDDRGNGLVLTSIYGRMESRTYAKPIVEKNSSYELSPEEKEAIRLAMQSRELGALPVEARDEEHEERIAKLKLFQERGSSGAEKRMVQERLAAKDIRRRQQESSAKPQQRRSERTRLSGRIEAKETLESGGRAFDVEIRREGQPGEQPKPRLERHKEAKEGSVDSKDTRGLDSAVDRLRPPTRRRRERE